MVRKITKWHLLIPFTRDYQRHLILADMERELGVSHQTLRKYIDILVRNGILIKEQKPKNAIYSINNENQMALNYLSAAEKIVLEDALERSTLLKRLYDMLSPLMCQARFAIFGSSAGGKVGNDIDLLAVGKGDVKGVIAKFEETYGKRIHPITARDFSLSGALSREIMKRHVILNGFDAFVQSFWELTWKK